MEISTVSRVLSVLVIAISARAMGNGPAAPRGPGTEDSKVVGMTVPSKTVTITAVLPGRIVQMPAPEGSIVRKGDLLVALDDGVQRAKTQIAKAAAESTLEIDLARVKRDRARREWDRLAKLHGDEYASPKELSDAQADAEAKRLEYELARLKHEQADRAYQRERERWKEYRLRAPFSGYVSEHLKHVGETVDQLEGIVTLVQLDPLRVVVDCPIALAPFVRVGSEAWVRPADSRWGRRLGCVVFASRVADGASQTFKVKLSVPNEDRDWLSGLKVVVDFAPLRIANGE